MGFLLSILYFLTYYLTPRVMFGPLAEYRVELILAIILIVVSLPALLRSKVFKTAQAPALAGLAFATFMSVLVGAHWAGGGLSALLLFIPNAFAYFLVYIHCSSKGKLQVLVLLMLFVCFFVIAEGAYELHQGLPQGSAAENADMSGTYFLGMNNSQGEWFYRLQGKGQINDPNDFAQLIVCSLPLTFFFWKRKRPVRNFFFVLVPVGVLIWGVYLTHSRGGMLGLLAIVIVALRRKIGTVPALVLAALLFVGASATNFTGGRGISTSAGEDRTTLWGDGLQLLKSHPVFGVGFGQMPEYFGHTAHNTVVVCAAELGFCGLFFWSMFLLPSLKDAAGVAFKKSDIHGEAVMSDTSYPLGPPKLNILDEAEIAKFARLLVLSFTGFLVTGWFLSRAYILTLFLLGGFTEAIYEMAYDRGMVPERLRFGRVLKYSGVMAVGIVLMMYILLRIVNLTH
ncbi:MAG TPA: O-antigen ligase family protein [Acidobacteriaceae bacterium]|nr:O-antigen ligase family protein [Acidobacteriaceae bacterium]